MRWLADTSVSWHAKAMGDVSTVVSFVLHFIFGQF